MNNSSNLESLLKNIEKAVKFIIQASECYIYE